LCQFFCVFLQISWEQQSPAANRRFGASGGVSSTDNGWVTSSFSLVRALPIPPPASSRVALAAMRATVQRDNETRKLKVNNKEQISMKNIYYHPRWKNISAGIILILVGLWTFFLIFIMFKIEDIHNFYDLLPNIKDGLSIFIVNLFFIVFCCYLIIFGILFLKNSKNKLKLKFDNDKLIYAKVPQSWTEARHKALVGLGYFEKFNSIEYKDILSVSIHYGIMVEYFKIITKDKITKDKVEHNLPLAFPKKDKEEILAYINKKMKEDKR